VHEGHGSIDVKGLHVFTCLANMDCGAAKSQTFA